jgi:hypothetical protein
MKKTGGNPFISARGEACSLCTKGSFSKINQVKAKQLPDQLIALVIAAVESASGSRSNFASVLLYPSKPASPGLLADFKALNWKEHAEILSMFGPSPEELELQALAMGGPSKKGRKKGGRSGKGKATRVPKGAPKKAPAAKPKGRGGGGKKR